MKIKRHHFYTLLLTITMMILALALLFINDWLSTYIEPKVEVREIHVATLPPPPPPPESQQIQTPQPSMTLSFTGDGPSIDISDIKIEQPLFKQPQPSVQMQMNVDFSDNLTVDWQAFGLGELDSVPSLLTRAKSSYPKALVKKGIMQVVVKLDIFIDESGKPTLISIKAPHYPELNSTITTLVKRARFSPPTKAGENVAARFIWPVEFKKT